MTVNKCFIQLLLFWFHLFRSADKIYEDEAVVHLVLPPTPERDGKDTLIPWPFYIDRFTAPPPPLSCLSIGWRTGPSRSHVFGRRRERGGDRYNITTCRTAEGSEGPFISHDASHGEWPRRESSLLFCIFFYIVKIIEKSLFYEPEIGFIGKITY